MNIYLSHLSFLRSIWLGWCCLLLCKQWNLLSCAILLWRALDGKISILNVKGTFNPSSFKQIKMQIQRQGQAPAHKHKVNSSLWQHEDVLTVGFAYVSGKNFLFRAMQKIIMRFIVVNLKLFLKVGFITITTMRLIINHK